MSLKVWKSFGFIAVLILLTGCMPDPNKETVTIYGTAPGVPVVSIVSPVNGSGVFLSNATISGTASVDAGTITKVSVKLNNGSFVDASGTANWTHSPAFSIGLNTVNVVALSDSGKTNNCVSATFYYDPTVANTNSDTYNPGGGWNLAWSDEFSASSLNTGVWNVEVRNDGCGNNELEYYTARPQNVWLNGGTLVIKAVKENYLGKSYTSGRLNSQNNFSWKYGKMVARIKLPYGRSLWPAFWMMGQTNLGWPFNGEIDIMEYRGDMISKTSSALHGPSYSGGSCYSSSYTLGSGNYTNDFHYYEMVWDAIGISTYVDGVLVFSKTAASVAAAGKTWVYDRPMYFLLNLGIGGTGTPYTGNVAPDDSVFPVYMFIDWVRIYTN